MGVCRQWRDRGYEATSTGVIWQLTYDEVMSSSLERFSPLDDIEDEGADGQIESQQRAKISLQSRKAFLQRRQSSLKLISIGNIPADEGIIKGFLEAIGDCYELLALDLQVCGNFTDDLLSLPEPVHLPKLVYLRTNLPCAFVFSLVYESSLRYAGLDVEFFIQDVIEDSRLAALALHEVRPDDLEDIAVSLPPSIRILDLHYKKPPGDWDDEVGDDLTEDVALFDHIEELRLHVPYLDSTSWRPLEAANLRSVSLSCQTCQMDLDRLLHLPQLENLHIDTLEWQDLVIGSEGHGLRRKKTCLKSLVIDHFHYSGLVIIDPESLVGRYASLQHLELGCDKIIISDAEDPWALVPLDGQFCNLILQTQAKLDSNQEERLLSLGFRSLLSDYSSFSHHHELILQYGAPERTTPLLSYLPGLYNSFQRSLRTSFAKDSEEIAILTSMEYQAFLRVNPWSPCYNDKRLYRDEDPLEQAYVIEGLGVLGSGAVS